MRGGVKEELRCQWAEKEVRPEEEETGLVKDIVHQAPDQLAEVGVVWDPHVVLSGVHGEFQVGLAEAPARRAVVLTSKYAREGRDVS